MAHTTTLDDFLQPLRIDVFKSRILAHRLCDVYTELASDSHEQFLPTPISDSVLRSQKGGEGRYLAIDIGGTNLRVGFIELLGSEPSFGVSSSNQNPQSGESLVERYLEKAWPIGEALKHNQAEDLFTWIGECIAEVVKDGIERWPGELPDEIPLGVAFSFPMVQHTLSDATLMGMGKGFAMTEGLALGKHLSEGYDRSRGQLPRIRITAIANDSAATLVTFIYKLRNDLKRKAAMALIVGTGTNATIPLELSKLHPDKRPQTLQVLDGDNDPKIIVNTEWSIKGAAPPLHELGFITKWDSKLDSENLIPGFQPFEYMTSGKYLGELGRIIIHEYFTTNLQISESDLPLNLTQRHGLTTTFLGKVNSDPEIAMKQLQAVLPPPPPTTTTQNPSPFQWTPQSAAAIYTISKIIQLRASSLMAAAIIALLATANELHLAPESPPKSTFSNNNPNPHPTSSHPAIEELLVGYTGGCISHFQDYLDDCQRVLDELMGLEGETAGGVRVVLEACHDGGILGAGILAGMVGR